MSNAKFELYKSGANGEFRFRLLAGNGENILKGEGYTTKASCENGIKSVKANAPSDARYERKSDNGHFWFSLKASNGEIIGTSERYTTAAARETGIESVKGNAPDATTVDLT